MSSAPCLFCQHANPAGAKYCNDCGSALRLRPCASCEAINDIDAKRCHQCDAALTEESTAPVPHVAASAAERRAESSVVQALAAIGADNGASRTGSAIRKERAAADERLDALWRLPPADAPGAKPTTVQPVIPPVRQDVAAVSFPAPVVRGTSTLSRRHGLRRALMFAVVPAAILGALFYGYRGGIRLDATADVDPQHAVLAAAQPGVAAAPARAALSGTIRVADRVTAEPLPAADDVKDGQARSSASATTSARAAIGDVAARTEETGGAALAAAASPVTVTLTAPATTPADASPAPAAAARQQGTNGLKAGGAPRSARAQSIARNSANARASTSSRRVRAAESASPSAPSPAIAPRLTYPSAVTNCTDGVAALGLCNRSERVGQR